MDDLLAEHDVFVTDDEDDDDEDDDSSGSASKVEPSTLLPDWFTMLHGKAPGRPPAVTNDELTFIIQVLFACWRRALMCGIGDRGRP